MCSLDVNFGVMSFLSLLSSSLLKVIRLLMKNVGIFDGNLDAISSLSLSLPLFPKITRFLFSPAGLFEQKGENDSVRGIGGE